MNTLKTLKHKVQQKFAPIYVSFLTTFMSFASSPTVMAQTGNIQGQIDNALQQIQTLLTGLIVSVGIVVALFIIIKRMPSADDPREKDEVYKAIYRVLALVAIGAAIVWVVPWVYGLFQ